MAVKYLIISSDEEIEKTISSVLGSVESDRIRSYLKFLTAEPHIAAGPRDLELTDWIRDKWTEFGLDTVSLDTYNFLLSFPDSARPNKIHLLDAEGNVRQSGPPRCRGVVRGIANASSLMP